MPVFDDFNKTVKNILPFVFQYEPEYNMVVVSTLNKSAVEYISKQTAEEKLVQPDLPALKRKIYQRVLEVFAEQGR